MWGECCHQNVVTPLETDLQSVDDVFARFASPNCSWRPFWGKNSDTICSLSLLFENKAHTCPVVDMCKYIYFFMFFFSTLGTGIPEIERHNNVSKCIENRFNDPVRCACAYM